MIPDQSPPAPHPEKQQFKWTSWNESGLMFHAPVCLGPVMGILISKVKNGWVTVVILERSFCLISKHWAGLAWLGLVFMTSDPSGETVNKIHPDLVTGDEQHNNTGRLHHSTPTVPTLPAMFWHQYTDCQLNEICHELLSWEFLTEKKRLSQGGQSRGRDKKGFLFLN